MRKRIVIAIAFIAVTVGFLLFKPTGKSIEDLKRRYKAACCETRLVDSVRYGWNRITLRNEPWHRSYERRRKRIEIYESQLINAGYLEARVITISNSPSPIVAGLNAIRNAWAEYGYSLTVLYTNDLILFRTGSSEMIARIREAGSNQLIVVAKQEEMPAFQDLIHKRDVP